MLLPLLSSGDGDVGAGEGVTVSATGDADNDTPALRVDGCDGLARVTDAPVDTDND